MYSFASILFIWGSQEKRRSEGGNVLIPLTGRREVVTTPSVENPKVGKKKKSRGGKEERGGVLTNTSQGP